jgi:hypothetical protein
MICRKRRSLLFVVQYDYLLTSLLHKQMVGFLYYAVAVDLSVYRACVAYTACFIHRQPRIASFEAERLL